MLDELSGVLSQMKEMSMDMHSEIDRYFSDLFVFIFKPWNIFNIYFPSR